MADQSSSRPPQTLLASLILSTLTEFDDLEMCTSLECGSQWWPANQQSATIANSQLTSTANTTSTSTSSSTNPSTAHSRSAAQHAPCGEKVHGPCGEEVRGPCGEEVRREEVRALQRLVEELRAQLSRSQAVVRGLQSRLHSCSCSSFSTSSDPSPATPRKVNWGSMPSEEEDEGWQSSGGGGQLRELVCRVGALEDQLRTGGKATPPPGGEEGKKAGPTAAASPGYEPSSCCWSLSQHSVHHMMATSFDPTGDAKSWTKPLHPPTSLLPPSTLSPPHSLPPPSLHPPSSPLHLFSPSPPAVDSTL